MAAADAFAKTDPSNALRIYYTHDSQGSARGYVDLMVTSRRLCPAPGQLRGGRFGRHRAPYR
jgi:hypothetical protein